ncbi:hypothetical protein SORBI_3006G222901 [Sorghum bicolor]|uniref:Uncharacterized protein n=1 Tax=Sorghum bicolor TaxID=4558 RepID=A0A1Z5RG19_SORBI|nr:hypothetical protein SORBI_3006G222901 [Sorghum bicolor]
MLSNKQGRIPVPTHSAAKSRPMTTAELIEPKIYGREDEINKIIYDITKGDYCDKDLTVLPIVGPGGIGKTTLIQVIYKELQHHFEEKVWVCVSTTFSVYRLTQEIVDNMNLGKNDSPEKLIEEKLKSKKFLLVLDDMWSCSGDDWRRFLVPFRKGQTKGSIVLVTTRFPVVAQMVKTTNRWIDLKSIDSEAFKDLFLAYVFGDKNSSNDHSGLLNVGFKIVEKLKGSPLAAKTVGRLLKKNLDLDHWNRVLESKEWELETGENDIMPALKLSYDYLPFHLQHCFSYCALFPEDYKFKAEELIHLWIGLDILHSHGENRRIEDIGLNHLIELINSGFFRKEEDGDGKITCYVIHDLLHELVLKISSHECLSINSANVGSTQIPPSIRYLSINIDDTSVKDKITFDTCQKDLSTLIKRLKVGSLRSFMLFGKCQDSFVNTVDGFLKEAKALRVIFLSNASYHSEVLLHNLSYYVHLRYLRIQSPFGTIILPNIISRFYHLRVLDLRQCFHAAYSTNDMCNLVKLRHFLVDDSKMHSSICEVGKLTSLQELKTFVVKKESQGFELKQLGHLTELCGLLAIRGLEKIELMEEVDDAKLIKKTHLRELILHWDSGHSNKNPTLEEHVLESLKPSGNILKLCISGQCGMTCPSWLGANLSVPNLESFQLYDVSWKSLPPLGEMWLTDEQGKEYQSCITSQSFNNLKRLDLIKIPKLKKWIGNGPCELFSHLKVLIIRDCPELTELPFTHHTGCEAEHEDHMTWFPKLELIEIACCPNLSSLPCIPWSSAMCLVTIEHVGSTLECLNLVRNYMSEYRLRIKGKDDLDNSFWRVLSFHNLSKLKVLEVTITRCPPLSLDNLQMLSSLKTIKISDMSNAFLVPEGDGQVGYQFPVESLSINQSGTTGEALTRLLSYFPKLHDLEIEGCEMLTGLRAVNQQKKTGALERLVTSSVIELEKEAQIVPLEQQQYDTSGEEDIAAGGASSSSEGLLLLPPQLHNLQISKCPNLVLCTNSLNYDKDDEQTGSQGGGLQGLHLTIWGCEDLRAQGRLTKLTVRGTPNFFAGPEPPQPHEQEFSSSSSKLQELETDDVAGVLAAPICTLLSSSLTELSFYKDEEVERFTKEQEDALQLLTSLEDITFSDRDKLQCLPAGLNGLPNLKRLSIYNCPAIRSLPKDGLPSSLQELEIYYCPAIQSLPKDCLPISLQKLEIHSCPAIRSLPKVNDLPSSLRELSVWGSESEELRRQCRKLIGIIPVVYA